MKVRFNIFKPSKIIRVVQKLRFLNNSIHRLTQAGLFLQTGRSVPTINKLRRGSTWVPKTRFFCPMKSFF
jgi:hypothetical protein